MERDGSRSVRPWPDDPRDGFRGSCCTMPNSGCQRPKSKTRNGARSSVRRTTALGEVDTSYGRTQPRSEAEPEASDCRPRTG